MTNRRPNGQGKDCGPFTTAIHAIMALIVSLVLLGLGPAVAAQAQDGVIEITGIVTVDGTPVPGGVELVLLSSNDHEVICGRGKTAATGGFAIELTGDCPQGTTLVVQLAALGLTTETTYEADPGLPSILVDFSGLTEADRATLNITVEDQSPQAQQAEPLLSELMLTIILLAVLAGTMVILIVLIRTIRTGIDFRKQTEAIVLIAVIIGVVLLGVTGKVGSDGLISVLAAIVGWTAARATTDGRGSTKPVNSDEPKDQDQPEDNAQERSLEPGSSE